jgi:hypothetical protein
MVLEKNKVEESHIILHRMHFMAQNIFNDPGNLPQTTSKQMQAILYANSGVLFEDLSFLYVLIGE